ncbi:MAG: hypothetical protein K6T73_04010 [Candidatus Bathyarchaeota archaeon]|nr:hypothetical protein [Candidatus Bathyarchaeota archaeon]
MMPLILKNYNMYELIPLIETWLEKEGFSVSVLANKVEGTKRTGFFSSENITILLEDYVEQCLIRCQGLVETCQRLIQYLESLPPKERQKDKEIIIREREIISIPCPYCRSLVKITEMRCPNCGAYIKGQ